MKTEIIYLINNEGIVSTYQNKAEAFNKLGYNFIVYSLAVELAAPDRDKFWDAYANRRFAKKGWDKLTVSFTKSLTITEK